jgi:hypothetical protein
MLGGLSAWNLVTLTGGSTILYNAMKCEEQDQYQLVDIRTLTSLFLAHSLLRTHAKTFAICQLHSLSMSHDFYDSNIAYNYPYIYYVN